MKLTKFALVAGGVSLAWIIMAIHRWWFVYPDVSQLLFALLFGFAGLAGAYIYNWMRHIDAECAKDREFFNNRYDVLYDEIQEIRSAQAKTNG